ncbi:phosphatase PAP2 family protein [Panacibacter ginsenosidivorans]|uniref:Phosphatase PAP2 family protein n=1 Tax=Panacibacter ginsenosidivorans TaxID=1813871 RepID=A0A5B8V3D6_9BACT|nr:phosphatase PAP2 family protein [Panacibacter ginsenosidivorans]QEC65884.1 phosphatase PAP2 family protein [Panacibacter ginsenosidivorans]
MKQNLNKKNLLIAVVLSLLLSFTLLYFSYNIGKENLFLLLNTDAGNAADIFFAAFTYAGDGIMWVPVLLIIIFLLKRKDALVLLISSFIFSTIFTQGVKNFIFPDLPRPIKAIKATDLIHTVKGVDVHTIGSFPSGHSATAFTIYLLFCLLLPKRWWIIIGFFYASLVGYSRVYLAQHFPLDVAGGIIAAILSAWFSMLLQQYWWKKKRV